MDAALLDSQDMQRQVSSKLSTSLDVLGPITSSSQTQNCIVAEDVSTPHHPFYLSLFGLSERENACPKRSRLQRC